MAVVLISTAPSRAVYDRVMAELGSDSPAGRLAHAAGEVASGEVRMVDIWESRESLDAFAARVVPAIQAAGGGNGPFEVFESFDLVTA